MALVSHATLFLEAINQKRRSPALSPGGMATLIPPDVISRVFWRAHVHGGNGPRGGPRGAASNPDRTRSARCGHDLQESLAVAAPAVALHQIHTHLWAAIIWRYIKGIYSPWYGSSQLAR